jgi:hypothetical protein
MLKKFSSLGLVTCKKTKHSIILAVVMPKSSKDRALHREILLSFINFLILDKSYYLPNTQLNTCFNMDIGVLKILVHVGK